MISNVAVLIVSYNVREATLRALRSIPADAQIVVVDNASQDGTPRAIAAEHPRARLIALSENRGFAYAVNLAAQNAAAPYLLLLNPDAWLTHGSLEAMVQSLIHHERTVGAWAIGPAQVDDLGRQQLSVGPQPTLINEACRSVVQRLLDKSHTRKAALVRLGLRAWGHKARQVPWVAGSALLITKEHYARIGGFDPAFFLYFEDIDFCLRIGRAGGAVVYDPAIVIGHSRGASAKGAQNLAKNAYRDSQTYFAARHQGPVLRRLVGAWARYRRRALRADPLGAAATSP